MHANVCCGGAGACGDAGVCMTMYAVVVRVHALVKR